jgi:hypothetical protein
LLFKFRLVPRPAGWGVGLAVLVSIVVVMELGRSTFDRSVESRSFCYRGTSPEANGSVLRVMLMVTILVLVTSCVLRVIGMLDACTYFGLN